MNELDTFNRYILYFFFACIGYAVIGFSWGAIMGGVAEFRHFVDTVTGQLIVRAHTHINLLGWVEMAIFGGIYYMVPRLVKRDIYSVPLVKWHFWIHNIGLIGMVVFFSKAGFEGTTLLLLGDVDQVEAVMKPSLAIVGISGSLVLLANLIFAWNIYKTVHLKRG